MKKALLWIFSIHSLWSYAQIINNDANISILGGTTVTLSNNLQNNASGNISHSGTIQMNGNLINNGTFTGNTGSLVRMQGSTEQQVSGSSVVNVYDFQVDNGGNGASVSNTGALRVSNQLQLINGHLFTADASPVRFTTAASNPTESNANHIVGTAIMEARAIGAGALATFLNFSMAAGADVGSITLTRRSGNGATTPGGFTPTTGIVSPIGFESIAAHWQADVTNNVSRDITLSWLSAWDNGKNLLQMQLWRTQSPFTIASPWELKTIGTIDMSTRTHTATAPAGELRNAWTVSDIVHPLPVALLSFNVRLLEGKDAEISWLTRNEINLSHFIVERSTDNSKFEAIHTRQANNQAENRYQQIDLDAKALGKEVLYYRLGQVDNNGQIRYTPSKAVYFNKPFYVGVYPNPFRDEVRVQIYNPDNQDIQFSILDNLGRELFKTNLSGIQIDFQPSSYLKHLSAGTYVFKILQNTHLETIKVVKQ